MSVAFLLTLATVFSAAAQRPSRGGGRVPSGNIGRAGVYRPGPYTVSPRFSYGFGYRPYGYSYWYRPYLGLSLGMLPYGYHSFYMGSNLYYYYDGFFYRPYNSEYRVVAPPIGAEVEQLPRKAESVKIDGQQYYVKNGVYYLPVNREDGKLVYRVAGKDGELKTVNAGNEGMPKVGDTFDQLPEGCESVMIMDQSYYVSPDGYYYQQDKDDKGVFYRVVGRKN